MEQSQDWSVCQICGRVSRRHSDPDWLDASYRKDPTLRVVRCPKHWSEWALRNCVRGRTNYMRHKLYRLRQQYGHWTDTYPFTPIPPDGYEQQKKAETDEV